MLGTGTAETQRCTALPCSIGALIGLVGGVYCSMIINDANQNNLGEAMKLVQIWVYLCGTVMGLCLAVAALPTSQRPVLAWLSIRVDLVQEDE